MGDNPGEPTPGEGLRFDPEFGAELRVRGAVMDAIERKRIMVSLATDDMRLFIEQAAEAATRTPPDEVTQKLIERLLERVRRWAATGEHARVTVPLPELQAAASALATQAAELHGIKASMEYRHSLIGRTEARATKAERESAAREEEFVALSTNLNACAEARIKAERDLAEAREALDLAARELEAQANDPDAEHAIKAAQGIRQVLASTASRETDDGI